MFIKSILKIIICFCFIILFTTNNVLASEKKSIERIKCDALVEFCPLCDYDQMINLIKEWSYPSSLESYLKKIEPIKQDIEEILVDNEVSKYYLYLALAESGGDTQNVSSKKAKGLWQLMPYISKHYGLIVDSEKDERLDYIKSTEAAALYIKRNLDAFNGNALWGIAAYNAGGSNLKRITNYRDGVSFSIVRKKSYQSYALAITVIKMIYVAECLE